MVFLFLGLLANGLVAQIALRSHRIGFYENQQAQRSTVVVAFEFASIMLGIGGFFIGFALFAAWVPLVSIVVGGWLVPTFAVTQKTFWKLHPLRGPIAFVGAGANLVVWSMYWG